MFEKYFKKEEFICPCGCGLGFEDMDLQFLGMIAQMRDYCRIPFVINSSIRCGHYNMIVGGSETSSHLDGIAVDIACSQSKWKYKIVKTAIMMGVKRIGIAENFLHIDVDKAKTQNVIWTY